MIYHRTSIQKNPTTAPNSCHRPLRCVAVLTSHCIITLLVFKQIPLSLAWHLARRRQRSKWL